MEKTHKFLSQSPERLGFILKGAIKPSWSKLPYSLWGHRGGGMKISLIVSFIFLCFLLEVSPTFAEENIVITLRHFFNVRSSQGVLDYSPMKEDGIPASEHVLIIKSGHCRDDAKDDDGNVYYFYMVDRSKGLKALVTEKTLDPTEDLDEYIYEFVELVKEEMKKDGGPVAIIEKFKKSGGVW